MAEEPGLLDTAWEGWKNWWAPKEVPAGAAYDAETLGQSRAAAIGALGGKLLALSQAGLQPAQRAAILAGIGDTAGTYQESLALGARTRLADAQAKLHLQEVSSGKASDDALNAEILRRAGGGGATSNLPTGGAVGDHIKTALAALEPAESGGRAGTVNGQGYSGRFQMGSALASAAGVYRPASDEAVADDRGRATNQWRGSWVLPGFQPMSHQQFLANPQAQQVAGEAAMAHNWQQIQAQGLDKYAGQTVNGVTVTPAGLLQGAWLGGVGGLKTWLTGGGDPQDSNKTGVSKWVGLRAPGQRTQLAALQPPGQVTANDSSGSTYPGEPQPGTPGAALPTRSGGGLADLSNEELAALRQMKPAERATFLAKRASEGKEVVLTDAQKRLVPNLNPNAAYRYNTRSGAITKIDDGPSRPATQQEITANRLDPNASWQVDGKGDFHRIQEAPLRDATPEELAARGYPPGTHAQIKPDGTWVTAREVPKRRLNAGELKEAGFKPGAVVEVGPDGGLHEIGDKGRSPDDPLTDAEAHGVLIHYAEQVRAGTLDPNSPEGLRYRAAHDMVSKGKYIEALMPDGGKRSIYQRSPVPYPKLGTTADPEAVTTALPPGLTESQAKSESYLRTMTAAEGRLSKLGTGAFSIHGWNAAARMAPEAFANFLRTPQGQLYEQAQADWTLAKLRDESGAAIGEGEGKKESWRYFPRPNDTAEVIQQKAEARATALNGMGVKAGRERPGATPPAAATPAANAPLPQGVTPRQVVTDIKARIKARTTTPEAAAVVLRKYGIDPSFLED